MSKGHPTTTDPSQFSHACLKLIIAKHDQIAVHYVVNDSGIQLLFKCADSTIEQNLKALEEAIIKAGGKAIFLPAEFLKTLNEKEFKNQENFIQSQHIVHVTEVPLKPEAVEANFLRILDKPQPYLDLDIDSLSTRNTAPPSRRECSTPEIEAEIKIPDYIDALFNLNQIKGLPGKFILSQKQLEDAPIHAAYLQVDLTKRAGYNDMKSCNAFANIVNTSTKPVTAATIIPRNFSLTLLQIDLSLITIEHITKIKEEYEKLPLLKQPEPKYLKKEEWAASTRGI